MSDEMGTPIANNWRRWLKVKEGNTGEFPLFVDAEFSGLRAEAGPYVFYNTLARPNALGSTVPGLLLRYTESRLQSEPTVSLKTATKGYTGGSLVEDVAAIAALVIGARVELGGMSRTFEPNLTDDPMGRPVGWYGSYAPTFHPRANGPAIVPCLRRTIPVEDLKGFAQLLELSSDQCIAFTRSARLYQDAAWLAEQEPNLAWLMLVSALEGLANCWRSESGTPAERLQASKPELAQRLSECSEPDLLDFVAGHIADSLGVTKKFKDFCAEHFPSPPPENERPLEHLRVDWSDAFWLKALTTIYRYRSKALHEGTPFPAPMCRRPVSDQLSGPPPEKGTIALAESSNGSTWKASDLPVSLNTFFQFARGVMLTWLTRQSAGSASEAGPATDAAVAAVTVAASPETPSDTTSTGPTPEVAASAAEPSKPDSRARKLLRLARWRLHWLAPNIIPSPFADERSYYVEREARMNRETRLPPNERLETAALWGVEFFGPNEVERLYAALAKLDWSRRYTEKEMTSDWVRKERTYGHGGSWYNVGLIVRRGDNRFIGDANHAVLPDEVDHAFCEIHQLTPSLTCLMMCFILKEEACSSYERELNLDRKVERRRVAGSWAVANHEPSHIKREAIDRLRREQKALVSDWFSKNLCGYFAARRNPSRLPTAELLITREAFLLDSRRGDKALQETSLRWRHIVAGDNPYDVWKCESMPALQLSLEARHRDGTNHLIAAVHAASIPESRWKHRGGVTQDARRIASLCRDDLEGNIVFLAVIDFLREMDSDLKRAREAMSLSATRRDSALGVIRRIQLFFDTSTGLPAISRELEHRGQTGFLVHDLSTFTAPPFREGDKPRNLREEVRDGLKHHSARLREHEAVTREQLEQLSTVLSVRESVRAQRRMEILTVLALLIATASLIVAVPDRWISRLKAAFAALIRLNG